MCTTRQKYFKKLLFCGSSIKNDLISSLNHMVDDSGVAIQPYYGTKLVFRTLLFQTTTENSLLNSNYNMLYYIW